MDRRIDVILALAVAALGISIIFSAQLIGQSPIADPIGPRGIPTGLGVGLTLSGVALAMRRVRRWRTDQTMVAPEGSEDDAGVPAGSARRAMGIWLSALVYVLTLPYLGFLIGTPIMVGIMLRLMEFDRPPLAGRIPAIVALPLLFTAAAYGVFAIVLGVRLPLGFPRDVFLLLTGRG